MVAHYLSLDVSQGEVVVLLDPNNASKAAAFVCVCVILSLVSLTERGHIRIQDIYVAFILQKSARGHWLFTPRVVHIQSPHCVCSFVLLSLVLVKKSIIALYALPQS
jgi:ABC-type cobalamin/Fe3+-siderophores transport system ATPase subunit